jgi:hypothetical protein
MRVWYIHEAKRGWHERNLYLCEEVRQVWQEAGHKCAIINVSGPTHAQAIENKNATCDVAYVHNFQTVDAMKRVGLDIIKRSRFRVYITGGGWRRPAWLKSSLKGIDRIQPNLVCLTHLPHYEKFKERHKRVFHVGLGFDPKVFYPDWEVQKERIVFVGDEGMGRKRRLDLLKKAFPGQVARASLIPHKEMAERLRKGAIGWNQIGKGPENGVSCNLRVWEVIGSGLFLCSSASKHVPLKEGKHYVSWRSDRDMIKKVGYYLKHADEREEIARAGWKESANHTWRHRALEYKELIERHL